MGGTDLNLGGYGGQPPSGQIPYQAPINPVTGLPLTQAEAQANIQDMLAEQRKADPRVPLDMAWTGTGGGRYTGFSGPTRRVEALYPEVGQYVPGVTPEPMPMRTGGGPYERFDTDITAYTEPASRFIKWLGQQPGNIPGYRGF
jgi:hypothetical protein